MNHPVKPERTGWRDEGISARHRLWGWDCPAVDIDFLLLEYDKGKPVAIIEYKNDRATEQDAQHPSYRALRSLANSASVPFLEVRYTDDYSWYRILPRNLLARKHKSYMDNAITEVEYVTFLYRLRNREAPPNVLMDLYDGPIEF